MSTLVKKMIAKTVSYAHLLGVHAESETDKTDEEKKDEAKRASWAEKAETDDERKQKDGESDDDYAKRMEKMDEEDEKKAKGEKEDNDSEGLEDDGEEAKAARQSERARCAKIIAHGINNGCAHQAFVFAFDTSMTSAQAIASLGAAKLDANAKRPGLGSRMATETIPRVGADAPSQIDPGDPQAASKRLAQQVIAAAAKARGEKV